MIIHPKDNVEVLLDARGDIPAGHKVAIMDIQVGEPVVKYGFPIGRATTKICAGEWVHSHNMVTNLEGTLEYQYTPDNDLEQLIIDDETYFMGYEREDGRVGIRNELWIIPTVGCVSDLAEQVAREFRPRTRLTVRVLAHTFGCSQLGDDHANTRRLLAALAQHPNAGGVLILGLGCENNQVLELQTLISSSRVRYIESQKVKDELKECLSLLQELTTLADADQRTPMPIGRLCIGLKCGGSDGFSGITANPLLGRLSDHIVPRGATTILTEVPEMFGAETVLMSRCASREVFDQTVSLINDFKEYYLSHGLPVGENPSPGNKSGGITTLEEKSMGCIQKGGTAPVEGVLQYAEIVNKPGLHLLCAPGNDLVASTALAASGCQMVLFTTGRGTPFGTIVPTLKVSTNTDLYQRKPHWIDFNAGSLLQGKSMEQLCQQLFTLVLDTANGAPAKNESAQMSSIAIWKGGVTL